MSINNTGKNSFDDSALRTDVPASSENVSRETFLPNSKKKRSMTIYEEHQKNKPRLDEVRKKSNIVDDDPFDFDNPTLGEFYRSFRQNKLSVAESMFNALYLWCYDNYYSSGVPIKNKYKNIYAHPTAWFHNAHHMWRHNKWSLAIKLLEIFPKISASHVKMKETRKSAAHSVWKSLEYSHKLSARRALRHLLSFACIAGSVAVVFIWNGALEKLDLVPALSLYVDGNYVGDVLSISDAESAKGAVEDALSIDIGTSYKLDCTLQYKATKIQEGSNLTPSKLSKTFNEVAGEGMRQGYGLYAYDVLIAVAENRQWLDESMNESILQTLSDEQKSDESIENVSYLNFTVREGTYPRSFFSSEEEIRHMFSFGDENDNDGISTLSADSSQAQYLSASDKTTLLAVAAQDSGTSSDIYSSGETLPEHKITIEAVITKTETKNESVPYGTDYIYDETLPEGKEEVLINGQNGSKTATYYVQYVGDAEISSRLINQVVVAHPVNKVVKVGTRPLSDEEARTKSTGTYIYPSDGELSSGYSWRTWGNYNEFHKGIDLRSNNGLVLVASDGGEVIQAEDKGDGYGLCILLQHDDGTITRYAHCSKLAVTVGQRVAQGEYIADMGATGKVTGVHVHFEIIKDGVAVDPLDYLTGRE